MYPNQDFDVDFDEERFLQENLDVVDQIITQEMNADSEVTLVIKDVTHKGPEKGKKYVPAYHSPLRSRIIKVPEAIYRASGIDILGKRIKSSLFTTDVALISNNNAQSVFAVYPFTPSYKIMQSIIDVASSPVFVGVGGGTTTGERSIRIAFHAEQIGAYGLVVNAPTANEVIYEMNQIVSIPIVATVTGLHDDYIGKLNAGADILNVSAGAKTKDTLRAIRSKVGIHVPIIATGGPTEESILETIEAGANAITYTPPSSAEIFEEIMTHYRTDNKD